jgi:hypothetical protein
MAVAVVALGALSVFFDEGSFVLNTRHGVELE